MYWVPPSTRWLAAAGLLWVTTTAPVSSRPIDPAQLRQPQQMMPTLPLTQLDERAPSAELDNRTLTLTIAEAQPITDVLMQLVRGTGLSVVPDPAVGGTFIGDLKNVTVRQALDLMLGPFGLDYTVDGTFVRVFRREPDTRIFDINYIASERAGSSRVGVETGVSGVSVSTTTRSDVFADIANGVRALLSERATFNVDRKAGLLQVTDVPERLDRVAVYLDAVQDRVQRQAQIDARVLEIELTDEKATGIDWTVVAAQLTGQQAGGQRPPPGRSSLTGMRVFDTTRLLSLLEAQGKVTVVASPRLLTLNNEPAIVRSETITLSVTAQMSGDSFLTLSLSPIVKSPSLAESDILARVADGETLVVSGFTHERETRERKPVGVTGGWFGRGTVSTRKRVELVILLTPRIIPGVMTP